MNFQESFQKLPADVKTAIYSVETSRAIEQIADTHHLLIDKMGMLAEEVGLVMLGATHPKDFIRNLSDKLGVDRETAKKIADDVNQHIFAKVRESLRKLHGITEEKETAAAPSAPPAMKETPAETGKPKPLEIKPAPALSWPASPIGPGTDKPAGPKIFVPRVNGLQKPQTPSDLPVASMPLPMVSRPPQSSPQPPKQGSSPAQTLPPASASAPPPAGQPPAPSPAKPGPAFQDKIKDGVAIESPELRKIERSTVDPYREPIE